MNNASTQAFTMIQMKHARRVIDRDSSRCCVVAGDGSCSQSKENSFLIFSASDTLVLMNTIEHFFYLVIHL